MKEQGGNEPRYFAQEGEEQVFFRFPRPNNDSIEAIGELLRNAPIVGYEVNAKAEYPQEVVRHAGSLDSILEVLQNDLLKDYAENRAEQAEWEGSFEYLACPSARSPGGVDIRTRLFYHDRPGGIQYARVIRRLDEERYEICIDPQ